MDLMLRRRLTPAGTAVLSCFALALLGGYAARTLFPESPLGAFLGTGHGLLVALAGAAAANVVATVVLAVAGHPCFARRASSR